MLQKSTKITNNANPVKNAVIFCRISSEKQEDGHSLEAQSIINREYCSKHNFTIIEEFSIVESSIIGSRPKFNEMIKFIEKSKDKVALVCHCIDRLHRDFISMDCISKLMKRDKIDVHFSKDGTVMDKNSDSSQLFRYGLDVLLANDSSNRTSERVRTIIEKKLNDGTIIGPAPIGYLNKPRMNKEKELPIVEIDHERAPYIVKCFEWYASGKYASMEEIRIKITKEGLRTKKGYKISKSQIETILQNPFYCGYQSVNGTLYEHTYERLISKELFDECQDIRLGRRRIRTKITRRPFIFKGLLKCLHCNCVYSPEYGSKPLKNGSISEYFYLRPSKSQGKCDYCKYTNQNKILPQVEEALERMKIPEAILKEIHSELARLINTENREQKAQISKLQEQYNKIEDRTKKAGTLLLDERIPIELYNQMVTDLKAERHSVEVKLKQLADYDDEFGKTASLIFELASRAHELFKSSGIEDKRRIIQILFPNLFIDGEKLVFNYRKPMDMFFDLSERPVWLPEIATFRTFYPEISKTMSEKMFFDFAA